MKDKVITYDEFCTSTLFESFVDYDNKKENSVNKISKLQEKNTEDKEEKEDRIESENSILFRGCMYGMLFAFALMLFVMNFVKELMY